ncbi:hypothetical protein DN748_04850 [Sinomicrobium soli]|nr:hypothetical protein DN748_04850 [Sinomicrobium sp. N-1-3-6]
MNKLKLNYLQTNGLKVITDKWLFQRDSQREFSTLYFGFMAGRRVYNSTFPPTKTPHLQTPQRLYPHQDHNTVKPKK